MDHHLPVSKTPLNCLLNGFSLACRLWPKIKCWLCSFVIFQGIRTRFAKKPKLFVILRGRGGSGPPVPPLDLCMVLLRLDIFIQACKILRYLQNNSHQILWIEEINYHVNVNNNMFAQLSGVAINLLII